MANSNLNSNEEILVKVDQNNIIFIDPNTVVNGGAIEPRNLKQEDLVIYVNLEADLVPRTRLILATENSSNSNVISIAHGTMNFLKKGTGQDYDSSWTESYTQEIAKDSSNNNNSLSTDLFSDKGGQGFGIESININIKGANYVPSVDINFIDVRGKTLFESPKNSPYSAFFHLPWPVFYLTVKGYYGKAIRYRLMMASFSSRYNENNGNFEIATTFMGSTYAYLNDIPFNAILNAPYMFPIETVEAGNTNTNTQDTANKVYKTSKGYQLLNSIYAEYKAKGLISKNFPVKTLREIITLAKNLDGKLEKQIFDTSFDPKIFTSINEYGKNLDDFEQSIKNWSFDNLTSTILFTDTSINVDYFSLKGQDKASLDNITGATKNNTLEQILVSNVKILKESSLFSQNNIKDSGLKEFSFNVPSTIKPINVYFKKDNVHNTANFGIAIHYILSDLYNMYQNFITQRNKFQNKVQDLINKIINDPSQGLGFNPTLRNLMAVVLANADVYVRLMKDVHDKAFNVGDERKIGKFSTESTDNKNVYPWPEIKKSSSGNKNKVLAYPGDPDLIQSLDSSNPRLWPEVEFIENYHAISTKRIDPTANKEGGVGKISYNFEKDDLLVNTKRTATIFQWLINSPYTNKTLVSILYEIVERMRYITLFDSFDNQTIIQLADLEFENIRLTTQNDIDILDSLLSIANPTNDDVKMGINNSVQKLYKYIENFSPYQRYPYYNDDLPTVPYIKDLVNTPFIFDQFDVNSATPQVVQDSKWSEMSKNLLNYTVEDYRNYIYPFNSPTYLTYLNDTDKKNQLKLSNFFNLNPLQSLVSSPIDIQWNKGGYETNLFTNKLNFGIESVSLLNTPYFHKQLYSDFLGTQINGKYAGSAYLLLNSLPFIELQDKVYNNITSGSTTLSTMFKEVSSTHGIPYHLMLKWGSIYHRYKSFILNGGDILSGFTTSNITQPINVDTFFDNTLGRAYIVNSITITGGTNNIGIHPYYDDIFHNIINDYDMFNISIGPTSYNTTAIHKRNRTNSNVNYWTNFVDNSLIITGDTFYTLLPCDGANYPESNLLPDQQKGFRILWFTGETMTQTYSGQTFPSYGQYCHNITVDSFDIVKKDYRKVLDLIGTFSPDVLNEFEMLFLNFASEKQILETPETTYGSGNINYTNFQSLLKEIVTIDKSKITKTDNQGIITELITQQEAKLKLITTNILSKQNYIKLTLANPKNLDLYVLKGFVGVVNNRLTYNLYDESQYTTGKTFIDLYLGEDIDFKYKQFFTTNNIELSEDNVLQFRTLIQIFAGGYNNLFTTKKDFISYLTSNVLSYTQTGSNGKSGILDRQNTFLNQLTRNLKTLNKSNTQKSILLPGYNEEPLKLEMYSQFKSFNDKWSAGNVIGQRGLLEEFLFLDKANQDIGDKAYISLQKIINLDSPKDDTISLYSVLGDIIEGSNFLFRCLPSYINFYGTNYSTTKNLESSKTIAKNVFGTFLEVDYQESSPKIILQYIGPSSKILDLTDIQDKMKFKDDSGNLFQSPNSPLLITNNDIIKDGDLAKSNKVVAFEVNVGDQYQSIFKSVQLDQQTWKNTYASQIVNENMGRSESGAGAYQVDIGLYDTFRQVSYSCEVTMLGNMMIQPTMYFYLKNIPMFRGSYWITEVEHKIKNGSIITQFKGSRMPFSALPDPKDSFITAYRPLFDMVTEKAIAKVNAQNTNPTSTINLAQQNQKTVTTSKGDSVVIDMGPSTIVPKGYKEKLLSDSGTIYGISYNGYKGEKYVQKITSNGQTYLRAVACTIGGVKNPLNNKTQFNILNKLNIGNTWGLLKNTNQYFYTSKFQLTETDVNSLTQLKTTFFNPNNGKTINVKHNIVSDFNNLIGPIGTGPGIDGFGIGLSPKLMSDLGLYDGQVVYFNIS